MKSYQIGLDEIYIFLDIFYPLQNTMRRREAAASEDGEGRGGAPDEQVGARPTSFTTFTTILNMPNSYKHYFVLLRKPQKFTHSDKYFASKYTSKGVQGRNEQRQNVRTASKPLYISPKEPGVTS